MNEGETRTSEWPHWPEIYRWLRRRGLLVPIVTSVVILGGLLIAIALQP